MDKRLPPLLVAVFINIAGFSLILPLLPFYGQVFDARPFEVALLFAAYSFGNVFGEIHWGRQSDVWGRRKVLVLTTFLAGLSYVRVRLCAVACGRRSRSAWSAASSRAR